MSVCVASISYSNSWLGQTVDLSSVSLITASTSGLYRVTLGGRNNGGAGDRTNVNIFLNGTATIQTTYTTSKGTWPVSVYGIEMQAGDVLTLSTDTYPVGTLFDLYVGIEQVI